MQLSHRLDTIASCVKAGSSVIDVGTDHAYIPIYLIKNNIVQSCIATDIHKGPLEKANRNVKRYKIESIDLRLTNGLRGIEKGKADTLIIAGMGGYLTRDILAQDLELVQTMNQLILQPQQDICQVRRFLHSIHFKIQNEIFIKDEDKYYTIIIAIPGYEKYENAYEYNYGKLLIEQKTELFKTYMLEKHQKLSAIYQHLSQGQSPYIERRKQELKEELTIHEEVMKCIF